MHTVDGGCSGYERGDDVGGVAVEAGSRPVVPHRVARIGVRGGFLHVSQRLSGVECGGDERVPQRVWADVLSDPGAAGHPADDPGGAVPVQPPPVPGGEQLSACPRRSAIRRILTTRPGWPPGARAYKCCTV
jgi:hypothetical protein